MELNNLFINYKGLKLIENLLHQPRTNEKNDNRCQLE